MLNRKFSILVASAIAVGALAPIGSAAPTKGTWTFTDTTPDPTVLVDDGGPLADDATTHCSGELPAAPAVDVNSQVFKAPKAGTLSLTAHNAADWAMEIRKGGRTIAGTDSEDSVAPENMTLRVARGKYEIVYCNFAGEPQITVDYAFKG